MFSLATVAPSGCFEHHFWEVRTSQQSHLFLFFKVFWGGGEQDPELGCAGALLCNNTFTPLKNKTNAGGGAINKGRR